MKILAIDTSSIYASCALLAEGDIRSEAAVNNGLVHSRSLMPMIERCLQNADTDIGQIDVFACVAGPGSFTGIRIGVCAVKGLAQALKKPWCRCQHIVACGRIFPLPQRFALLWMPGAGRSIVPYMKKKAYY